jgi:hypothetical protein
MEKITLPKLHLACGNYCLRPIFDYILFTKDDIVASDAHIICVLKTMDVFGDEFINKMPDRFLLHKSQWKDFYNNHVDIKFEKDMICVYYEDYKIYYDIKIEREGLSYPDYNAIFPKKSEFESIEQICINPILLKKLQDSIIFKSQFNKSLKLTFSGQNRAILVNPVDIDNNSYALIMPVKIS